MNKNGSEEVIAWGQSFLKSEGYPLACSPRIIRKMPWSFVVCFEVAEDLFYLKWNAGPFACEARLIPFIRQHISSHVPEIISSNEELSCFLMKNAGTPLRLHLKEKFQPHLFSEALKICAQVQIACTNHIDEIKRLGVNDWRVRRIPSLFEELLSHEGLLRSDGMTSAELACLAGQKDRVSDLCERLLNCNIPESLDHGDFHDNNILIREDSLTINDWGDASLTHPYFSCVSALGSARRNHNLKKESSSYQLAQEAYLNVWKNFGTHENQAMAMNLAEQLREIIFALSFSRVKFCPGIEQFPKFSGIVADSLRQFLKNLTLFKST